LLLEVVVVDLQLMLLVVAVLVDYFKVMRVLRLVVHIL
jgi:hypothetical protein